MNPQDLSLILDQEIDKIARFRGSSDTVVKQLRDRLNKVNNTNSTIANVDIIIQNELKKIREILEIRANLSIDFVFLSNKKEYESVYDQLRIDNLRMENCAKKNFDESGTEIKPEYRLKTFSVYATFQIETLLNLYFMKIFNGSYSIFKSEFDKYVRIKKSKYTLIANINNISSVPLEVKLVFFLDWLQVNREGKLLEDTLIIKNIRNGEVHRAVELGLHNSFIMPYPKQNLVNIYNNEIMYYDVIRQVLKEFVNLIEKSKLF